MTGTDKVIDPLDERVRSADEDSCDTGDVAVDQYRWLPLRNRDQAPLRKTRRCDDQPLDLRSKPSNHLGFSVRTLDLGMTAVSCNPDVREGRIGNRTQTSILRGLRASACGSEIGRASCRGIVHISGA